MSYLIIIAASVVSFLAFPALAHAEVAESTQSQKPPVKVVLTGEVGGGQTTPSPTSSTSSFFYERAAVRVSPDPKLDLRVNFRATEDLARAPDTGSTYATKGDVVLYGGLDGSYDLSDHFTLTLGANGSPKSQRDIWTSILAARPNGTSQTVNAAVRSNSSSIGGLAEIGYDSADDARLHAVEVAVDLSGAVTRFETEQTVLAPVSATRLDKPQSASLVQSRVGAAATVTVLENTDLSLDFAYFVYDQPNPNDVGLFTSSAASGLTTSFGAGLPMLPARCTLRPEVGERIGLVALSVHYQYANLSFEQATGHTIGGRAQIALGSAKIYALASYRADVFTDATAATWTAGAGASFRL